MDLVNSNGILQFTYFPCEDFDDGFLAMCQQGMGIITEREQPITKDMFFVIVNQTCDLANPNVTSIEGFFFKKANSKQVRRGEAIKYTRNYQKILFDEEIEGNSVWFLLKKEKRFFLDKNILSEALGKQDGIEGKIFSRDNQALLLGWLTKSYTRVALPDGFNQAFFTECVKDAAHPFHLFLIANKDTVLDIFVFCDPLDSEDADKYDVTFTALVSSECDDAKREELESGLRSLLEDLGKNSSKLNLLQINGEQLDEERHEGAIIDLVMTPRDFTKQDEFLTHCLNLDFLCFKALSIQE